MASVVDNVIGVLMLFSGWPIMLTKQMLMTLTSNGQILITKTNNCQMPMTRTNNCLNRMTRTKLLFNFSEIYRCPDLWNGDGVIAVTSGLLVQN